MSFIRKQLKPNPNPNMNHTKTDSDATSLTASSPPRSPPRRPVYYVQSPSHDGEKTLVSSHSTPGLLSPTASPPHSHSFAGHHSRESSSTRFSGKVSSSDVAMKRFSKPWDKHFNSIEEEGLLDDEQPEVSIPRRCYVLGFIVCFLILFFTFALILYGAAKPQKPKLTMTVGLNHL